MSRRHHHRFHRHLLIFPDGASLHSFIHSASSSRRVQDSAACRQIMLDIYSWYFSIFSLIIFLLPSSRVVVQWFSFHSKGNQKNKKNDDDMADEHMCFPFPRSFAHISSSVDILTCHNKLLEYFHLMSNKPKCKNATKRKTGKIKPKEKTQRETGKLH